MNFGREVNESAAFSILDAAFSLGMRLVDTAELYPHPSCPESVGLAESIIGRWLRSKPRDSVIISTKISGPSNHTYISPARGGHPCLDGVSIRRAVDDCLRRLQIDYIDLLQTHWPDHGANIELLLKTTDLLFQQGKVRAFGCCNETPWGMMKMLWRADALGIARPEWTQQRYNAICSSIDIALEEVIVHEDISVIAYEPLAGGVLSGKYLDSNRIGLQTLTRLADGHIDTLHRRLYFSKRAHSVAQAVLSIAHECAVSPCALALSFCLNSPMVATTLLGARTPYQLEDVADAFDGARFAEPVRRLSDHTNTLPTQSDA